MNTEIAVTFARPLPPVGPVARGRSPT